jgi:hypothetical protein
MQNQFRSKGVIWILLGQLRDCQWHMLRLVSVLNSGNIFGMQVNNGKLYASGNLLIAGKYLFMSRLRAK